MEQMNAEQLWHSYTENSFQENFARIYSLRFFFYRAFLPEHYNPPEAISKHVLLTPYGGIWFKRIHKKFKNISEAEALFALFCVFSHVDLFIDVSKSHFSDLIEVLSGEILGERLRFPWVFDRELYDRFFVQFPRTTDSLTYEQSQQLLKGTSPGVFQMRDILIGPYGALLSSERRNLRPLRTVPLWHCSDPTCNAIHPVLLTEAPCKASDVAEFLKAECERLEGPGSEWDEYFGRFDGSADWYDDMSLDSLPWLLANSFSEREARLIFEKLLTDHSKELRARLPETNRFKKIFTGSSSEIATRLRKSECFQLILLMKNTEIAEAIESLIEQESIKIPVTEVRTPGITYGRGGWLGIVADCSRFGIRSVSGESGTILSTVRLRRLIKELHCQGIYLSQLEWKLRHVRGQSIFEKLDQYLHQTEPSKVLADFILTNPEFLEKALRGYRCSVPSLPVASDGEAKLIEKLLWKLGFDIPLYPEYQDLFWRRSERLLNVTKTSTGYKEIEKEVIRSAAVNFFVSLEEILDYSLSFITWVLFSDHFGETKFKCNFDKARIKMAEILDGRQLGSNEPLKFDPKGKNTLYPLVSGFAVLSDVCREVLKGKQEDLRRPNNQLPGFHGKTELQLFPFLHKVFLLDIRESDQTRILDFLSEVTGALEKSEISNIRNRLEHRRTDFPSQEEIEKAMLDVSSVVEKMEKSGVCPLIYVSTKVVGDRFGRSITYFRDYKGREIELFSPSQYEVSVRPLFTAPTILVPWIHLGESTDILSFMYSETSDYEKMWENYPRRRTRTPD